MEQDNTHDLDGGIKMGSNVSRHSGKGLSGRRTQSSGERRTKHSIMISIATFLFVIICFSGVVME